ncbi:MAG: disulfide bond formation protein DsbB [Gammaproteobacteria bacterium RIFCSPLOWO2_02_47_7]|nr:MAG: disulfide bond formation protein DsbB [Gammaproteobacteria bacterium RIFCSPLOWO2_02_47_7]OGT65740.1 MAG: disulfide bond formation protein DsbB [Gammaproteobacteria bacterium RIFCSPLOWO2_01_FULL_47_190]OGT73172.1 MAG: disulfide bond formation protein DsbB [Gammaproteobacteria bacterium RIFCSPLOWO2_12_47_11]OGT86831.1 MAG: disulfide bond formation protein DsbB [Gammaproteobacteria bacterium RIFCSPLOWO2_12_FULL_47_76]
MNSFINTRLFYISIFLICGALLGFGLYLEHGKGLEPCPLCVFQRIAFISIAMIALIAALHGPDRMAVWFYNGLISLAALIGGGIATRQVWLQHLPAGQVPECGPGLDYMLETFPLGQALQMILSGSGECAEVGWSFLGFSIAEWSLLWFLIFLITGLVSIFSQKKTTN